MCVDVLTGCKMQLLHTLTGHTAPVLSCSFSADGQMLVSGSVDTHTHTHTHTHILNLYHKPHKQTHTNRRTHTHIQYIYTQRHKQTHTNRHTHTHTHIHTHTHKYTKPDFTQNQNFTYT